MWRFGVQRATLRRCAIRSEPEIARRAYPHWIMPALMTFNEHHVAAAPPDAFDADGFFYPHRFIKEPNLTRAHT